MGKKLTDKEYLERRVHPLLQKAHALCVERDLAFFFTVLTADGDGCMGLVASDEDGNLLPHAHGVLALRRQHELEESGIFDEFREIIASRLNGEDCETDCDGECQACIGTPEVQA